MVVIIRINYIIISISQDYLPCKLHQGWIQRNRQKKMTNNNRTQWINSDKVVDPPEDWESHGASNHEPSAKYAEDKGTLKAV